MRVLPPIFRFFTQKAVSQTFEVLTKVAFHVRDTAFMALYSMVA